jgi:uncharacterized UBP type Zn finger protein
MSYTVKLLTTKNVFAALDWCLNNLDDKNWSMNSVKGSIFKRNSYDSTYGFVFLSAAINNTNPEMHKAHYVDFEFTNEEDAVYFKMVWL